MPEENQPSAPAAPAPPTDELFATPETPAPNSVGEKIRAAGGAIFERFGIKAGRGRPRKDGQPKKSDRVEVAPGVHVRVDGIPAASQPANVASDSAPAPKPLDGALVRKCVGACLKAISGWADRVLYGRAIRATRDSDFAKNLVAEATVDSAELNAFSELAEVCLQKYGVGSKYAPEIGLVVISAGIATRYALAMKSLEEEIQRRRAEAMAKRDATL